LRRVDGEADIAPYLPPLFEPREDALVDGATLDWDMHGETLAADVETPPPSAAPMATAPAPSAETAYW
jgi:hypothetical protein